MQSNSKDCIQQSENPDIQRNSQPKCTPTEDPQWPVSALPSRSVIEEQFGRPSRHRCWPLTDKQLVIPALMPPYKRALLSRPNVQRSPILKSVTVLERLMTIYPRMVMKGWQNLRYNSQINFAQKKPSESVHDSSEPGKLHETTHIIVSEIVGRQQFRLASDRSISETESVQ